MASNPKPKTAAIRCVTCQHPLPEGQDHPDYFAQAILDPTVKDVRLQMGEFEEVLRYTRAVFRSIGGICHMGDPVDLETVTEDVFPLTDLGKELCDELERRAKRLYEAGNFWQEQAEAHGKEA